MALALIFILTFIVYLINRKKFIGKTITQKIWMIIIYTICVLVALFIFFEILHIIKYHETSL
jgi:hypothetical protein